MKMSKPVVLAAVALCALASGMHADAYLIQLRNQSTGSFVEAPALWSVPAHDFALTVECRVRDAVYPTTQVGIACWSLYRIEGSEEVFVEKTEDLSETYSFAPWKYPGKLMRVKAKVKHQGVQETHTFDVACVSVQFAYETGGRIKWHTFVPDAQGALGSVVLLAKVLPDSYLTATTKDAFRFTADGNGKINPPHMGA
jgi:hypothetical protein